MVKTSMCLRRKPIATSKRHWRRFACCVSKRETDDPFFSQADFVAPSGYKDYLGMVAVACFGWDELATKYGSENDDYSKIMAQALADRFVEAFAEYPHREIRINLWG
jgi:5-methyltetrahydrofolate--homocysteine methyltransferase